MKNDTIKVGQITIDFLLETADTNGSISMFEFGVPVGAKVPLSHYHENYDETIYGLEGIITFTIDDRTVEVAPGESCFIPRGVVHRFNNPGPENARALAIITPALLGPNFFEECAEIVNASGPPDVEKLKIVMNKYGLVPVLPD